MFQILNSKKRGKCNVDHRSGFTLLELLITIAIIGLLTGISIFALSGAREQARDGKRKSDLETIRSALELYKADCNVYPSTISVTSITGSCTGGSNTYLTVVPKDPTSDSYYDYEPNGTNTSYTLCTYLENPPSSPDITGCGTCSPSGCGYKVVNP
jgi:general secretion pathway protein G